MSAKKKITNPQTAAGNIAPAPTAASSSSPSPTTPFYLRFLPYLLLLAGSLLLYANTFHHQYALDDEIVISKNEYVLRGLAGMKDIFSKDLFDSFYKQMNTTAQLSGGRYRPLAVASFALEQEFIGTRQDANFEANCWDINHNGKMDASEDINHDGNFNDKDYKSRGFGFRHIDNAVFYGLAVCLLFLFLHSFVFKEQTALCLIISLLFLAHPVHTEVVANVKSRDEIFSFGFMILTLYLAHRFALTRTIKWMALTCIAFFAALLSKEYGATLLVLVPLSLYLFGPQAFRLRDYIKLLGGMLAFLLIYYALRSNVSIGESNLQENELMNNPFLLADEMQKHATHIFIFLKYIQLLIFPHPLSCDYGYNSIPYKDFGQPQVWLALLSMAGLAVLTYMAFRKKHWSCFALAFYLLNILLVTNFIFNIGATMGERLVFHSSLGFCILAGYGLYRIGQLAKQPALTWLLLVPVLILYSVKTYSRNKAWENDITLALTDVQVMPESVALNGNASSRNLDLSELPAYKNQSTKLIRKAIGYGQKAVHLHPGFVNGYLNLGLGYAKLEMYDSAKYIWDIAFRIYRHHPSKPVYYNLLAGAYYKQGFEYGTNKNWKAGEDLIRKATDLDPSNARYWYDLGGFAYNAQDYQQASNAWNQAFKLKPDDPDIQKVHQMISGTASPH